MGEIKPLKMALTFEQQLNHLINDKHLKVGNKKNALSILKHENYYRLSGYMIDFLDEDDMFEKNSSFEKIYNIYKNDKEIRSTLFELINDIEVYLKTQTANYFSIKYGPEGYLNPLNFKCSNQKEYNDIIELLKKCNDVSKHNKQNLIVKHHDEVYGGFMPLWAIVELMSLGTISKFFSLMQTKDKKAICRIGFNDITYDKLESFYHCVTYIRNQCCHYQRFYRIKHIIKPKKYRPSGIEINEVKIGSTYALVLVLLYLNPNKNLGERAIRRLKKLEEHHVNLKRDYGFDDDWEKILNDINGHCIK